jgi:hypothetical protein
MINSAPIIGPINSSRVDAATEAVDPYPNDLPEGAAVSTMKLSPSAGTAAPPRRTARTLPTAGPSLARVRERAGRPVRRLSSDLRRELLWITVIYVAARMLLILAAVLLDAFNHRPLQTELANWDGLWYRAVANHGYPSHVSYHQTNLGFFPLYPIAIYLVSPIIQLVTAHNQIWASTFAGVLISGVGGLIATVFVHRLAEGWWDRATARRATVLFVFFCGSVVFSMVYSEGLLLPLAAVCIWALERRRWMLAGVMAGLGTAVQPVGLVLGVVCGVCALRELWQHGPRSREFGMSLLAAVMSATGAVAFAAFLWAWTGSPFANLIAQHHGWGEKTNPLALVHQFNRVAPSFDPSHFNHPTVNLNLVVGTVGAVLMIYELWLLWRSRRELSLPAIVWTLGITYFAFTSQYTPPNPRLILTAFPMLVLLARWIRPQRFPILVCVNVILFVGLSLLTFYAHVLRP